MAEWIPIPPGVRKLALTRAGSGTPPVAFETGLGAEPDEWEPVFQAVSAWTSVCRYDRANRGQSDPAPVPRTVGDLASDLHALLMAADIYRPVVLVGHSLGGWIAREFAHRYPADVAGLVLVDPMHEDQFERTGPLFFPQDPDEPSARTSMRRFWMADWRDPAKNAEGVDFPASQTDAHAIRSLGVLPLTVLTAGAYLHDTPSTPDGFQQAARLQAEWRVMHREIAAQSTNGVQLLVESSGHFVQREQPAAIVQAIGQMLETVRGESGVQR